MLSSKHDALASTADSIVTAVSYGVPCATMASTVACPLHRPGQFRLVMRAHSTNLLHKEVMRCQRTHEVERPAAAAVLFDAGRPNPVEARNMTIAGPVAG